MEVITLPVAELKPALTGLSKVVNKRSTLSILGMIKVERTADGWIALTGSDLDTFATVRLEQPAEGNPLTVLVPLESLQTAVKSCGKNESIQLQPLGAEKIAIKTPVGAGWAETKCDAAPIAEFPALPKFSGDLVPVPDAVRSSIHEAMRCASEDPTRLILNGAYLDVSDKKCHTVVGTDGRHLYSSNSFSLPLKESVIVPMHRFLDWKEFNHDGEWRLKTGTKAENKELQHLQLTSRRWRFITRQIDGNYPNWRQVVPDMKAVKTTVEIENVEPILQAIRRMPDHNPTYHTIGLVVENGGFLLLGKANREDTEWFSVPIPNVKAEGENVRVNANREQMAKALEFGLTRIEIIDEMSPLRFVHEGRQMIMMPVRVDEPVQTSATNPATAETKSSAQSSGKGEAETAGSTPSTEQPANERSQSMPEQSTVRTKNTENGYNVEQLIEQTLTGIEELQEAIDDNVQSLNSLRAKVKILHREYKAGNKEVEGLKKTLKGLQSVKL